MAKSSNKRQKSKSAKAARQNNGGARAMRGPTYRSLDIAAADYAGLLADPCGGKLVHPVYPGGDAGFLFRADSFVGVGIAAGDTAGIIHWTPGYVNNSATEVIGMSGPASTTSSSMLVVASASPGRTFLINNAKGVRCVAACMKITFSGSESARAGRIHYGHTNAGILDSGVTATPDGTAQTLQHYTRTPPDTIELVWRPNISDTEFNDPTETASAVIRDRKSALTLVYANLPPAVGITLHFTAVYEWTPAVNLGVSHNAMGKAVSRNTLDDVLDALKARGFGFVRQAGQVAGAAMGQAALGSLYGLMGAAPRGRPLLRF